MLGKGISKAPPSPCLKIGTVGTPTLGIQLVSPATWLSSPRTKAQAAFT
jgi:hypothetical protein